MFGAGKGEGDGLGIQEGGGVVVMEVGIGWIIEVCVKTGVVFLLERTSYSQPG